MFYSLSTTTSVSPSASYNMARFVISLSFAALVLGVLLVSPVAHAQNQAGEKQLDPNAQCDQTTRDQITSCLDQIEQDESKLPSGPCSSSGWFPPRQTLRHYHAFINTHPCQTGLAFVQSRSGSKTATKSAGVFNLSMMSTSTRAIASVSDCAELLLSRSGEEC